MIEFEPSVYIVVNRLPASDTYYLSNSDVADQRTVAARLDCMGPGTAGAGARTHRHRPFLRGTLHSRTRARGYRRRFDPGALPHIGKPSTYGASDLRIDTSRPRNTVIGDADIADGHLATSLGACSSFRSGARRNHRYQQA
ncbi:hypothetical protein GCM10009648_08490 [Tsukamurella spumae]